MAIRCVLACCWIRYKAYKFVAITGCSSLYVGYSGLHERDEGERERESIAHATRDIPKSNICNCLTINLYKYINGWSICT